MCMFEDICGTGRSSASKTHVIERFEKLDSS